MKAHRHHDITTPPAFDIDQIVEPMRTERLSHNIRSLLASRNTFIAKLNIAIAKPGI